MHHYDQHFILFLSLIPFKAQTLIFRCPHPTRAFLLYCQPLLQFITHCMCLRMCIPVALWDTMYTASVRVDACVQLDFTGNFTYISKAFYIQQRYFYACLLTIRKVFFHTCIWLQALSKGSSPDGLDVISSICL